MADEKKSTVAPEAATDVADAPDKAPEAAAAAVATDSSADKDEAVTEAAASAGSDDDVEVKEKDSKEKGKEHGEEEEEEEEAKTDDDKVERTGNAVAEEKADDDMPHGPSDVEMKDAAESPAQAQENNDKASEQADSQDTPAAAAAADAAAPDASTSKPSKGSSKSRPRKSSVGAVSKVKALNRKGSKARILHLDAKPGDHYFVKLKGYPQWPCIICDEDMLPQSLLKTRPVTAMRPDGTYREDYAEGGRRVHDRTYPVMYLFTNEFGWVPNTDIVELDHEAVLDLKTDKMRKDLQAAHDLAAEKNDLAFYKDLLQQYQEELIEQERAKVAKATATPKSKKKKTAAEDEPQDEDVEMADAADEEEEAEEEVVPHKSQKKASSSKKRKAAEPAETPQRADSVKRPKIKITTNSTPKIANGTTPAAPKTSKPATEAKSSSKKAKKPAKEAAEKKAKKEATPTEPELTAEEKHDRKQKEVLFFRHKLQKGLLTRDQEPKPEEMKTMSEYIMKLESLAGLEASIIRGTKIHKVLKAILKLESIPKEDEFKFKSRSQILLDGWLGRLAAEGEPQSAGSNGPAPATAVANGAATEGASVNGTSKDEGKSGEKKATNGTAGEEKKDGAANGSVDEEEDKEEEAAKPAEGKKDGEGAKKSVEKPAAADKEDKGKEQEEGGEQEKADVTETKAPETVEASA